MLKDTEKDTVDLVWNFDDTGKGTDRSASRHPNLLVNGSTGISADMLLKFQLII